MKVHIRGGRLLDPRNGIDAHKDLYITDERISAIGRKPSGFKASRTIDARGLTVCPGLVDLSARLREPGAEYKATISSETRAAAAAGVTSLCCPPDTDPVIDNPSVAESILRRAISVRKARVYCIGALTQGLDGEVLADMAALADAGCIGVGNAQAPIADTQVLRRALEYAASCDVRVFLSPEDRWLAEGGRMHEGATSTRLGIPGIPTTAETIALARDLQLIAASGASAHIGRLSSAAGIRLIADAQRRGLPVTADTGIAYLHLCDRDVREFDPNCHVRPPLRDRTDRTALRKALARGTLQAICSDHQPHDADAKIAPFSASEPGMSMLELLLPLTLALVAEGVCDELTAIAALTSGPANIIDLKAGSLGVGDIADICIYDPQLSWTCDAKSLNSAGHNNPWLGRELTGRARYTLRDGKTIHALS